MKLKRSLVVALAAVLLVALALPVFAGGTAEKKAGAKLKIAYIRPTNEPYYKFGFDGAQMMADKMGVELLGYISDMKPEKELNACRGRHHPEGGRHRSRCRSARHPSTSSVNAAYNAKVPIFMLFGYSEALKDKMVGSVQADAKISGGTIGKWVARTSLRGRLPASWVARPR